MYFVVVGMPEPVLVWTEDQDIKEADRVLSNIIMSYENDFAKHAEPTDVPKIQLIWDSLPSQLARENKKFLYIAVKDGARAREYENALNWLYNADLVRKTFRTSKPGLPLSAYDDLTAVRCGTVQKAFSLSDQRICREQQAFYGVQRCAYGKFRFAEPHAPVRNCSEILDGNAV